MNHSINLAIFIAISSILTLQCPTSWPHLWWPRPIPFLTSIKPHLTHQYTSECRVCGRKLISRPQATHVYGKLIKATKICTYKMPLNIHDLPSSAWQRAPVPLNATPTSSLASNHGSRNFCNPQIFSLVWLQYGHWCSLWVADYQRMSWKWGLEGYFWTWSIFDN